MSLTQNPLIKTLCLPVLRKLLSRHRPTAICIGAAKSGTTSLFSYLNQHPNVVSSKKKEINFFESDINYAKGDAWYLDHFRLKFPFSKARTLDVTPAYLAFAEKAAPRIYKFDQSLKIIALLRDPIARAYSNWQMYLRYLAAAPNWWSDWLGQLHDQEFIREYIPRESDFFNDFTAVVKEEIQVLNKGKCSELEVVRLGKYFDSLTPYYDCFPKEQILVLDSQAFFTNTAATLRSVENFLEIPNHDWTNMQLKTSNKGNYSENIPTEAVTILREYYQPELKDLRDLTGTNFSWV